MFMRFALFALALLVLAGCAAELPPELKDFRDVCVAHKGVFMKMNEMRDGQVVGEPCFGCMPDTKSHICDKNEYLKYIRKS